MSGPGSGQDTHYPLLCGAWQLVFTSPGVIHHITGVEITIHQDLSRNNYFNNQLLFVPRPSHNALWVCVRTHWVLRLIVRVSYLQKRRGMCWMLGLCLSSHLNTLMTRSDTRWSIQHNTHHKRLRDANEYFLEVFVWIDVFVSHLMYLFSFPKSSK